jgi:hypothetical protein
MTKTSKIKQYLPKESLSGQMVEARGFEPLSLFWKELAPKCSYSVADSFEIAKGFLFIAVLTAFIIIGLVVLP